MTAFHRINLIGLYIILVTHKSPDSTGYSLCWSCILANCSLVALVSVGLCIV